MRPSLFFIGCLIALWSRRDLISRNSLELTFFDVGQGDGALVRFPNRQAWLVDAGGGYRDWDTGRDLLLELARSGITALDAVIVSHPDLDHVMGFRSVLDRIPVRALWVNGYFLEPPNTTPLLVWMLGQIRKTGGTVRSVDRRQQIDVGGVHVRFFSAESGTKSANEHSLVLQLEFAGCRVLLTGDIEKDGEASLGRSDLAGAYTAIKVAHHGSRTSSSPAFLERFPVRISVVSSGVGNSYGHPHPAVVKRLLATGTQVLRTDFHGYVRLEISPEGSLTCVTSHGSCGRLRCP